MNSASLSTTHPNSKLLYAGLVLYAFATLGSQVMMSIGTGLAVLLFVAGMGGPHRLFRAVRDFASIDVVRSYLRFTLFFMGACLLSLVVAAVYPLEIGGNRPEVTLHQGLRKVWYFFWPILLGTIWSLLPAERSKSALKAYLIAVIVVSTMGILQFFTGFPRPQPLNAERTLFHTNGLFGHHLAYATVMSFPFFILLDQALKPERRVLLRKVAIAGAVLAAIGIFLSWSRMAWIALPIGIAVMLVIHLPARFRLAAVVLVCLAGYGVTRIPPVHQRLFSLQGRQDRYELWEANLELFKRRPVTGVGWHNNPGMAHGYYKEKYPNDHADRFVGHAHNNFLHFLAGTGILGALGMLAWIWTGFRISARHSPEILVGLIVLQVNGLTQLNLLESKSLHTIMFMLGIALWRGAYASRARS